MKWILFQPFSLEKWFIIGFCAWLAHLGQSGVGGGPQFNINLNDTQQSTTPRQVAEETMRYVQQHLSWIIPLVVGVVLLSLAIWLVLLWLSSRGQFMLLHCVIGNVAEVREPWRRYALHARSLFLFRLAVIGLVLLICAPVIAMTTLLAITWASHDRVRAPLIVAVLAGALFLMAVGLAAGVILKLTRDFVVPVMWLRTSRCVEAWREFLGLLRSNLGAFVLYLLFQLVLKLATGILVVLVGVATCFIGCCLMIIPYLGTVATLPVPVFFRSYSLYYLAQYGAAYSVFPKTPPPSPGVATAT